MSAIIFAKSVYLGVKLRWYKLDIHVFHILDNENECNFLFILIQVIYPVISL